MTLKETCKYLRVSKKDIKKLIKNNKLHSLENDKNKVRISRCEISNYVTNYFNNKSNDTVVMGFKK